MSTTIGEGQQPAEDQALVDNYEFAASCWYCGTQLDDTNLLTLARHMNANPEHNQIRIQMYVRGTAPPPERTHAMSVLGIREKTDEELAAANSSQVSGEQQS